MSTFRNITKKLEDFWEQQGVTILPSYDLEMGAATYSPFSTLKMMEKNNLSVCFLQKCRRAYDSMGGENGNRLYCFHQMQVMLKPSPHNVLDLFMKSLDYIGLSLKDNEIKFGESDWSSPSIGSYGIGWEVLCNGMEIAQFTHFKKIALQNVPVPITEITYGVERLLLKVLGKDNIYECPWDEHRDYGEISRFYEEDFKHAQTALLDIATIDDFNHYIKNGYKLLEANAVFHGYEQFIKACNVYNLMEKSNQLANFQRGKIIQELQKCFSDCLTLINGYNTDNPRNENKNND
jgi:glycyl-tRNA synthetase alpha chain